MYFVALGAVKKTLENPEVKMVGKMHSSGYSQHINKANIFKGIKILLFCILLVTVLSSYARDIYEKFDAKATTFARTTEQAKNFFVPPLVICMENGLKPTVLRKYGVESTVKFPGDGFANKQLPIWDAFVESSYIINRDFILSDGVQNFSTGYNHNAFVGYGQKGIWVHVSEYHTIFAGTCYQIDSNLSIPPPLLIGYTFQFNESLDKADIPPVSTLE